MRSQDHGKVFRSSEPGWRVDFRRVAVLTGRGMKLLLIGHGYLGRETARVFRVAGWDVVPVSLSGGDDALACDVGDIHQVKSLPAADFIVHCAASGRGGPQAYQRVYVDGCRNWGIS
jgi:nucleoside-diphosphate-sugar epimerase